jgi:hypothetical protein
LGKEEIQVTESVRSLTYGAVENVPIAKNCPDPCIFPTVSVPGIIVSEVIGSGGGVFVTETDAVAFTTYAGVEPLAGFVHSAVMLAVPTFTPLARPGGSLAHTGVQVCVGARVVLTVAIDGILELHVICCEFVTSSVRPELPIVASAMNWPDWPEADSVSEPGIRDSAVMDWAPPPLTTVKSAVPVATVLAAMLVYSAVIVTVPLPTAVASPGTVPAIAALPIVAICVLLDVHVDKLVRSSVAPVESVPMTMNWLVSPGIATD